VWAGGFCSESWKHRERDPALGAHMWQGPYLLLHLCALLSEGLLVFLIAKKWCWYFTVFLLVRLGHGHRSL